MKCSSALTIALLTAFHFATALDAPVVTISCEVVDDTVQVTLDWDLVVGATHYAIYSKNDPYSADEYIDGVQHPPYRVITVEQQFFCVVAREMPALPGFTLIPGGAFSMGDESDTSTDNDPEHRVTLTNDFYLGTCEVTNGEYCAAVQWAYDEGHVIVTAAAVRAHGELLLDLDDSECEISFNDGVFSVDPVVRGDFEGQSSTEHPVKELSWYGAVCYCDWLSMMEGLEPFYYGDWNQTEEHNPYTSLAYRLPTEAEWEFAAQYRDDRVYPWGETPPDCDYANFEDSVLCVGWTAPVGNQVAGFSQLGLVDVAGNLREWVGDWYSVSNYDQDPEVNPLGATEGSYRSVRGGSWIDGMSLLQCANRYYNSPGSTPDRVGFRVARTVTP